MPICTIHIGYRMYRKIPELVKSMTIDYSKNRRQRNILKRARANCAPFLVLHTSLLSVVQVYVVNRSLIRS